MAYRPGATAVIFAELVDANGVAAAPSAVDLNIYNAEDLNTVLQHATLAQMTQPQAGLVEYAWTIPSTGHFYWRLDATLTGGHVIVDGTIDASAELAYTQRRPRSLCTLLEVKRLLPNYQEPTEGDEREQADRFLLDLVESASQKIHEVSGREFVAMNDVGELNGVDFPAPPSATRSFDVLINSTIPTDPAIGWKRTKYLKVGDLASFTAIAYGDPWVVTRFSIDLTLVRAKPLVRAPWQPIRFLEVFGDVWSTQVYDVTGIWGFPQVPMDVRQACAEQAAIWAGRDLRNFSQAFLEAVAAGASPTEPRSLAQSVFDTAVAYQIPDIG